MADETKTCECSARNALEAVGTTLCSCRYGPEHAFLGECNCDIHAAHRIIRSVDDTPCPCAGLREQRDSQKSNDSLRAEIAASQERERVLREALSLLKPHADNEATGYPWWGIVLKAGAVGRGRYVMLAGPFFDRESAEAKRRARLYAYGEKSLVYCFSGHESADYVQLRKAAALLATPEGTRDE